MYLKQTFCNNNDSMFRQNDKMRRLFFSFSSLRFDSFYHIMQIGVTVFSLTNVTDM